MEKYTLAKKLPCEICTGRMFYIRRMLCEHGYTEAEYFETISRKECVLKIVSITKCDKEEAEKFIDLLISVGVAIEGSSQIKQDDDKVINPFNESDDE